MPPRVVMISFWRNDSDRFIDKRAMHLLKKTYPNLRWIWSVGDCTDDTEAVLREYAEGHDVEFVDSTTGIEGAAMPERLRRLSRTASITFEYIREDDDYVMVHESDLESPSDVIERLLSHGNMPIAAWPMFKIEGGKEVFYDIWAFHRYHSLFLGQRPYHIAWLDRDGDVFEVDGFGSVWMAEARDIRGMKIETEAVREICRNLKSRGRRLWTDCSLTVIQPPYLYEEHVVTHL